MNEIIYILVNESMPGYVKIGKTSNSLDQRIKELSSSTSIPLPFTCFYACIVKDSTFVEHQLHDAFGDSRVNPKREFFQISPQRVVSALKLAEIEDITPRQDIVEDKEDREALEEARKRRSPFRFEMVDIPPGSEIVFSNNENIRAKVLDDRFIELNGEKTRLSNSAQRILGYNYGVAGTDYWMYDGETLDERRRRIEKEKDEMWEAMDALGEPPEDCFDR